MYVEFNTEPNSVLLHRFVNSIKFSSAPSVFRKHTHKEQRIFKFFPAQDLLWIKEGEVSSQRQAASVNFGAQGYLPRADSYPPGVAAEGLAGHPTAPQLALGVCTWAAEYPMKVTPLISAGIT